MSIDTGSQVSSQLEMTRNVNDLNSTNMLRQKAKSGGQEALREVAQQFEAIFVRMLMKTMRQAQDTLADKENPLNSDQMKFYRDMHDQQLAVNLSSNGSLGLADVIVQQLQGAMNFNQPPPQNTPLTTQKMAVNTTEIAASVEPLQQSPMQEKKAAFASPDEFVEYMMPKAQRAAEKIGVDPKALVAQAALETGWGKFVMQDKNGNSAHNLFGIKADSRWDGDKVIVNTMESENGVTSQVKAAFRSYDNFSDSIDDYVDFLKSNSRYGEALNQTDNASNFFRSLQDAGYATDPNYADKLISIYQGNTLNRFLR